MKILYIANSRIPTEKAHGAQVMKQCEAFSNTGHEVTLLTPTRKNPIKEDAFTYYDVPSNFKLKRLYAPDFVRFGKLGFLFSSEFFAKRAFLHTILNRYDMIYSRDELSLYVLSFFKNNLVYEIHNAHYNFFARILVHKNVKLVTISNGLKEFYIKKGVDEHRILVAHDAVDLARFERPVDVEIVKERLQINTDKPIVMYLGRLDPWKGVETLLQASQLLKDEAHFVIAGVGSELEGFKEKYPHVQFLGNTPYKDLGENQRIADVLVVPNSGKEDISKFYTSPLKVFAHMASGVPVVASDLPSIREILNDSNALLASPDNPESFRKVIHFVLNNKEEGMKRAEVAKRTVQKYTWQNRAVSIIEFFRNEN